MLLKGAVWFDPEQLGHRGLARLRTRKTISRSICSTASNTSNSGSGNDLCTISMGWLTKPNIANSSSLHRKCARTPLSAVRQLRNRTPSETLSNPAVTIRQADLESDLLESRVRIQF